MLFLEPYAALVVLAVGLFVTTDLDDLFVLIGFFSDTKYSPRQVALGQLLGVATLYGVSVVASLLSLVVSPAYIGLLGIFPIVIGARELWELWRAEPADDSEDAPSEHTRQANLLTVAAVTVANGGDNMAVYTPIFATRSIADVAIIGVVFALMTLVWLIGAFWLTRHRTLGVPIRQYGHRVVPFVLVALGFYILHEAGTISMVRQLL